MAYRYSRHYTLEDARALLPQIREWLDELVKLRDQTAEYDAQIAALLSSGNDLGSPVISAWLKTVLCLRDLLRQFQSRQIQLKDIDRGLIDFPSVIGGKEVFLCWEKDEEDIEFWHELDAGYAGREHL
jgi:hypothetical protein